MEEPTRRAVVVAGVAAGACVLAACSGGSGNGAGGSGGSGGSKAASAPLVALADVPVGGAVAAKDPSGAPVVVAQPTAGTAVAFSAICTHMGCQVAPAGKQLNCPCHGSQFDATNGAVLRGPAARPLPSVPVRVENGQVVAGA